MFEEQKFFGTKPTMIALETRKGIPISNEQSLDVPGAQRKFEKLLLKHDAWSRRVDARPIYNCAGLVWAARRTSIYEDAEFRKIYRDDGYRELLANEEPVISDIAVYHLYDSEKIIHVGVVWSFEPSVTFENGIGTRSVIPMILSKFNDHLGEAIHPLKDIEWPDNKQGKVVFWTDRGSPNVV
jgi:hypothetical protein